MSAKRIWNLGALFIEASKYKTRNEFYKKNNGAYSSAHKQGLIDEVCRHMPKPIKWDKTLLLEEAKKYKTRTEFSIKNQSAYCKAKKLKLLDAICSHMDHAKGGSDNDCIYLWKAKGCLFNGLQVYKIGITSHRLSTQRIKDVARKTGFEAEILAFNKTSTKASDLEKVLLQIGIAPNFTKIDGASEFRAMTDDEVQKALWLITYKTKLANG